MNTIVKLSENLDARDKFTKALQNTSRILAWYLMEHHPDWERPFRALFGKNKSFFILALSRDSRKVFALFRSLVEYRELGYKLNELKSSSTPVIWEILSRFGFFFYWIFENIQLLMSIKFFNGDMNYHVKLASWGWVVGLVFSLAKNFQDLVLLLKEKQKVEAVIEVKEKPTVCIDFEILKVMVDISAKIGDLIEALQGTGMPEKYLGKGFSEGIVGFGGLWSAAVSLWKVYLKG